MITNKRVCVSLSLGYNSIPSKIVSGSVVKRPKYLISTNHHRICSPSGVSCLNPLLKGRLGLYLVLAGRLVNLLPSPSNMHNSTRAVMTEHLNNLTSLRTVEKKNFTNKSYFIQLKYCLPVD